MSIYYMYGKYSAKSLRGISSKRTNQVVDLIQHHQGHVKSMFSVIGEHDLFFIVDFPTVEEAKISSVDLHKLTGISFTTSPMVNVEKFDKMIDKVREI